MKNSELMEKAIEAYRSADGDATKFLAALTEFGAAATPWDATTWENRSLARSGWAVTHRGTRVVLTTELMQQLHTEHADHYAAKAVADKQWHGNAVATGFFR